MKYGFLECKRSVLDLLIKERSALKEALELVSKKEDGVTVSKIIGRIELLQILEKKIFALESFELSEH